MTTLTEITKTMYTWE